MTTLKETLEWNHEYRPLNKTECNYQAPKTRSSTKATNHTDPLPGASESCPEPEFEHEFGSECGSECESNGSRSGDDGHDDSDTSDEEPIEEPSGENAITAVSPMCQKRSVDNAQLDNVPDSVSNQPEPPNKRFKPSPATPRPATIADVPPLYCHVNMLMNGFRMWLDERTHTIGDVQANDLTVKGRKNQSRIKVRHFRFGNQDFSLKMKLRNRGSEPRLEFIKDEGATGDSQCTHDQKYCVAQKQLTKRLAQALEQQVKVNALQVEKSRAELAAQISEHEEEIEHLLNDKHEAEEQVMDADEECAELSNEINELKKEIQAQKEAFRRAIEAL